MFLKRTVVCTVSFWAIQNFDNTHLPIVAEHATCSQSSPDFNAMGCIVLGTPRIVRHVDP